MRGPRAARPLMQLPGTRVGRQRSIRGARGRRDCMRAMEADGEIGAGARVRIAGLVSRADLNGTEATVLHYVEEAGRWAVRCDGGELVRAKPANLELLAPSDGLPKEVVSASDMCGSSETLESLGVPLSSILPQARTIDVGAVEEADAAAASSELTLIGTDGMNLLAMRCKYCDCPILPPGKAQFIDASVSLPKMPGSRKEKASAGAGGAGGNMEDVGGFWLVKDKFDFDNMGVTRPAADGMRYIICGECDLGPIGWFRDEKAMHVAVGRVRYK